MGVILWKFRDAPTEYRLLSENGGDEDWLMLVPSDFITEWYPADEDDDQSDLVPSMPYWLERMTLAANIVDTYRFGNAAIIIGSHA